MARLAEHFVTVLNDRYGARRRLRRYALEALERHPRPGNVRELLHAIEAAAVVCDGNEIVPGDLARPAGSLPTLERMERDHIARALKACDGHRGKAARMVAISERNLHRELRERGLPT